MRKSILAGALIVAAACSGDGGGGGGPLVVTTVSVTATPTQITVGGTAQASAIVKDQNGNALTGKTVSWTSLQPAVAAVNPTSGLITGVSAGTATVQGTAEGVSGTATVIVIAAVSACNTGITVVDLPVGGVRVLSASETQGCIKMPATTGAPADYMVIAGNNSSTPDLVGTYVLKSDEGENVPSSAIAPSNDIFSANATAPRHTIGDLGAGQIAFETRLRLMERRELRIPDAQRAYRERLSEAAQGRFSVSSAIPAVGERLNFKVPARTNACSNFTTITAEVKYVNDKAIIYTDVAAPANGFTATDYQQIGDEFSSLIYPTDVAFFGTPLDDDNNQRVVILYTPEVNKLTEPNSTSFVGGFFFAGDLFPSTGAGSCAQSNQAELFYMLAPDPDGTINNNKRSLTLVRQNTRGTIAHEFEHMINASERIRSPILQDFEDVWLDEALSHFAEDATGRALRGISETEDATFSRALGGSNDDFNAFFFQNLARFRIYLNNPGPFGPTSEAADTSLAVRGAAWALLRYAADQYSGGDVKLYTRKLAGGPNVGVDNLVRNAVAGTTFEAIVNGWMIANYADNAGIPGLSSLYSYKVYDMRSMLTSITAGQYPLKVTTVAGSGFVMTGLEARSGSGNYFFAQRNAGAPARTWRFLNSDGTTAATFTGAAWIILRTR